MTWSRVTIIALCLLTACTTDPARSENMIEIGLPLSRSTVSKPLNFSLQLRWMSLRSATVQGNAKMSSRPLWRS